MMVLVIGGSGSGKSLYAESLAVSLSEGQFLSDNRLKNDYMTAGNVYKQSLKPKKFYLATMLVSTREGQEKVEIHRKNRAGKGFITIEQPTDIESAVGKMGDCTNVALLECMSNLTANEMFSGEKPKSKELVVKKITDGVRMLKEKTSHLVVVSNNVFEDGNTYDETTMQYISAMGDINRNIASMADKVVEVVVGIPVIVKQ